MRDVAVGIKETADDEKREVRINSIIIHGQEENERKTVEQGVAANWKK